MNNKDLLQNKHTGMIHMPSTLDELAEMLANRINDAAEAARADRQDFRAWNEEETA